MANRRNRCVYFYIPRPMPRETYEAQGDRNHYAWSTPAAFAFFVVLIVLTLLFVEFWR